jgi:protein TonB
MKKFKKPNGIAGQSNTDITKSQKHDANVQKNTTLYFQIGLILCLLGTYMLFEMQFQSTNHDYVIVEPIDDLIEVAPEDFKLHKESAKKVKPLKKKVVATKIVKADNDAGEEIPDILLPENNTTDKPAKVSSITVIEPPVDPIGDYNTMTVEEVPVYPGCEKSKNNEERRQCMSKKLTKLIQKKFNTDLASEYGLSGKQVIHVQFKIDKNGNVVVMKTRAPHFALEKETERVINKIPKMKPGLQGNKPVNVLYQLPIIFQVRD